MNMFDALFGVYLAFGMLMILVSFIVTYIAVKAEGYWIEITKIYVFKLLAVIVFWPAVLIKGMILASKSPDSESFVEFLCKNGDFTMAEEEGS
jgi:hypothetical protein